MNPLTETLWAKQDQHEGDRLRLFRAVVLATGAKTALYPGSYVDIAPSFVCESVTYVDIDKRASKFFADAEGMREIIAAHAGPTTADVAFIHADYTSTLDLPDESFDLLVSLYAGFISEHCTQHLKVGGTLLVNASHGDAAMASIDPRYELSGVVTSRDGDYSVRQRDLDAYLIPKKPLQLSKGYLHDLGKGIAYTKPAFAYLFTRVI